jgi:hypothetical protein
MANMISITILKTIISTSTQLVRNMESILTTTTRHIPMGNSLLAIPVHIVPHISIPKRGKSVRATLTHMIAIIGGFAKMTAIF